MASYVREGRADITYSRKGNMLILAEGFEGLLGQDIFSAEEYDEEAQQAVQHLRTTRKVIVGCTHIGHTHGAEAYQRALESARASKRKHFLWELE